MKAEGSGGDTATGVGKLLKEEERVMSFGVRGATSGFHFWMCDALLFVLAPKIRVSLNKTAGV